MNYKKFKEKIQSDLIQLKFEEKKHRWRGEVLSNDKFEIEQCQPSTSNTLSVGVKSIRSTAAFCFSITNEDDYLAFVQVMTHSKNIF